MSDLISRQDAIKELESGKDKKAKGEIGGFYNQIIENGIEKLRELPSAQPERKTERWIYDGDCYVCSECRSAYGWWADSQVSNYCPNCGTDMRGEQDE